MPRRCCILWREIIKCVLLFITFGWLVDVYLPPCLVATLSHSCVLLPSRDAKKVLRAATKVGDEGASTVPKLVAWLRELQLETLISAACRWCEEQGACDLEEIVDNLEDFAEALPLDQPQLERLQRYARVAAVTVMTAETHIEGTGTSDTTPSALHDVQSDSLTVEAMRGNVAKALTGIKSASISYAKCLSAWKADNMQEAKRWFVEFEAADSNPRLLLIQAAGMAGDCVAAERCFAALVDKEGSTLGATNALIGAYAKAGDMTRAEVRFDELLGRPNSPNTNSFGALLDGYSAQGNVKKAEEWFEKMIKMRLEPNIHRYGELLRCYENANPSQEGKAKETLSLMDKMLTDVIDSGEKPSKTTIQIVIDAHARVGSTDRVKTLRYLL